jgi:hypothetical protein
MVMFTALGAKYILDWNSDRENAIRLNAYSQGYLRKEAEICEYDEGYCDAKDKHGKKDEDEF